VQTEKTKAAEATVTTGSETAPETECATTEVSTMALSTKEAEATETLQEQQPSEEAATPQKFIHFYLHKPHTSSTNTVLIPLTSNTTLTAALYQKYVLEFPTIYVFSSINSPEPTNPLPNGFITLEQYTQHITDDDKELQGLMSSIPEGQRKLPLDGGIFGGPGEKREEVDEKEVLEMLQRDADALQQ
jgi:hypothetical protein